MQLMREHFMNPFVNKNSNKDLLQIEYFIEMMVAEKSAAKNTLLSYKTDLLDLAKHILSEKVNFNNVSQQEIENYICSLFQRKLTTKSIARKISTIRQFFNFLLSDNFRKDNPALHLIMPKREQNLPSAISQEQISLLIENSYKNDTPTAIRMTAMLEMLYATGMRISELITLKMQSLESKVANKSVLRYVFIKGKGNKERIALLNKHAAIALEKYLSIRNTFLKNKKSDWLFPSCNKKGEISHLTRQRFGQMLKKLAISCGLEGKLISPHKIRHSFASHMLENGANLRVVQELLGHSDISSTQIYTKVSNKTAEDLVLNKHPVAVKYKNHFK